MSANEHLHLKTFSNVYILSKFPLILTVVLKYKEHC